MSDLTYEEAAREIAMSVAWLKSKVQAREVPHHRYGRQVRFTDSDIAAIRNQFFEPVLPQHSSTVIQLRRRRAA